MNSVLHTKRALAKTMQFDIHDVIASITKESFYEFVREFWDTIIPETFVDNWHIKYICDELQYIAERVFLNLPKEHDLVINISPGSTKSTICSVMFPAWVWTRMPSARIIGGSYTHSLAMDLSLKGRDIVKSEKYRKCFPNIKLRPDQDTKTYFKNVKGGSRYAVGVGGSVVGMHGHFLIIDDPLDPQAAVSEAELKTSNTWMTDTLPNRKVNKLVVPTILIMQRLHQNDCTANMIEQAIRTQTIEGNNAPLKIKHICIPAELSDDVKPAYLKKYYKDGLMDTVLLPLSVLNENKAKGDYSYAGQFMQNPIPAGGGMFKTDRIHVESTSPTKWIKVVRFWDKAGTAGGQGAFTVGLKMGEDINHHFWILDVKRGRWDAFVRENHIKQTAAIDGREVDIGIEQEPGSGGKESAQSTVMSLRGYNVWIDKPSGSGNSKEQRANPFATQVAGEHVYMLRASWNAEYIYELAAFPDSTFKDQVDASSGAFNKLTTPTRRVGALFRRSNRYGR